jgi:hypothetical protein
VKKSILALLLILAGLGDGRACDLCGCYTPQLETISASQPSVSQQWWSKVYFAVSEQFTAFGTAQFNGHEVPNPTGQYENSSITQLVASFGINDRFSVQLNAPLIYREFKRPEGFTIEHGTEAGFGDLSLLLNSLALHYTSGGRKEFDVSGKNPIAIEHEPDFTFSAVLLTGVKFPTGDSSRLEEEFHEIEVPGAPRNGIHGHDLTLGTGSFDGIFGGQMAARYHDFFADGNLQFTLRGEGTHQYDFANDLTWDAGPGYYFIRQRNAIAGLQFVVSGEHKSTDRFRSKPADDTGITSVFVGPRVVASWGKWSAQMDIEVPVSIDNTAFQIVPDSRIRAGISFHF